MPRKTSQFTIKDKDLATALEISLERLYEIIGIFDADSHDEWELKEDDHFTWLSKNKGTRLFSELGAFAIAQYMDSIEKKTLWDKIVEFITKHKERIRNAFVRQKVLDHCSSLTVRNNRHFLSKRDVVNIFCTSYARINKAFEDIQHSNKPMILHEDFDDIENIRYYSLSGLEKLSRILSQELKSRDRQEWCAAVEIAGSRALKQIISAEERKKKDIQAAMYQARKRDQNKCQITGKRPSPANNVELASHHIFSQKHYPQLATSLDNLITLTDDIHKEFHHWNGGFDKPCTIDELIQFVNELYPEREEISLKLNHLKKQFCYVKKQNLAA